MALVDDLRELILAKGTIRLSRRHIIVFVKIGGQNIGLGAH